MATREGARAQSRTHLYVRGNASRRHPPLGHVPPLSRFGTSHLRGVRRRRAASGDRPSFSLTDVTPRGDILLLLAASTHRPRGSRPATVLRVALMADLRVLSHRSSPQNASGHPSQCVCICRPRRRRGSAEPPARPRRSDGGGGRHRRPVRRRQAWHSASTAAYCNTDPTAQ